MVQCSTGTSSHQPATSSPTTGHDLCLDLEGLGDPVLTRQWLGHRFWAKTLRCIPIRAAYRTAFRPAISGASC